MRILFVCVGNTCRSQMAEALARDRGHFAQSAGTHPGTRIAPNAVVVLNELGINTEGQSPKSINDIDSEGFDQIISMGCGVECPSLDFSADWGLEDPVGQSMMVYRLTRDRIRTLLDELPQS